MFFKRAGSLKVDLCEPALEKTTFSLEKMRAYSPSIQQVPKLEPEHRFLNEPARAKSICASRLVQKTTFSLEKRQDGRRVSRHPWPQREGGTSLGRPHSFASPARTHDTNTKRNEADFPVWGEDFRVYSHPPTSDIHTYKTTLRVIRRLWGEGDCTDYSLATNWLAD